MKKTIKFYRVENEYGLFSNFSEHPVGVDGTTWQTTEHYFQAQKFLDRDLWWKVMRAETPGEAAKIGRNRENPLRIDWEEIKDGVMKKAVLAKVMQHYEVRKMLLDTGDAILIEHTKNDSYWGDGGDGSGKNMLGKILMEIRADLTKHGAYDDFSNSMDPLWLAYPDIPRYSIGWRMGGGEDYSWNFSLWWRGLNQETKDVYQKMYPEPKGWKGWYTGEHLDSFEDSDETD